MIGLAALLLALATADLVRWSPDRASCWRAAAAVAVGTATPVALVSLGGWPLSDVAILAAVALSVVGAWVLLDDGRSGPGLPLAYMTAVVVTGFAASSLADPVGDPLAHWYASLPFPFVESVGVEQFLLAVSAGLFLLATGNRVVRLILAAAGTSPGTGEMRLRGGPLLGPMERLVVAATVIAGDPTGAALVVAAKGLLRLPEIRDSTDGQGQGQDQVTEYFLIGTFSSLLLAALMGALVLASG